MAHLRIASLIAVLGLFTAACGPGEVGPQGPAGPIGPKGDAGASGIGLTKQTFCFGTGLFGSVAVTGFHTRYDFADGSAFVDCRVEGSNGAPKDTPFPLFFKSTDPQVADGACSVTHDVDTANGVGSGQFEFRIPKGLLQGRMVYRDSTSGYDGTIVAIDCLSP